jgi:hypothetical protein
LGIAAECLPRIVVVAVLALDRVLQVDSSLSPLLTDTARMLAAASKTELAALRNMIFFV